MDLHHFHLSYRLFSLLELHYKPLTLHLNLSDQPLAFASSDFLNISVGFEQIKSFGVVFRVSHHVSPYIRRDSMKDTTPASGHELNCVTNRVQIKV